MGKEGDLWDDSALITAFDDAISNYKKMHKIGQLDGFKAGEQESNDTGEALLTCIDENNDAKRQAEEDCNKEGTSHLKPDLEETSNEIPSKENQNKPSWNSSHVEDEQNVHQGYPSTQCAEDYNQLLKQYNEIEEQRQKIMQQLEHFNYWSWCSPQQYSVTTDQMKNQTNQPDIVPPYNPYYNQCMVAPCYLGGTCTSVTCNGQSAFIEDSNVTKAALVAAEKAISSLKIENPEKKEVGEGQLEAGAAGETNLNDVFNAWYTAGFYTGKYMAEHSIAKKH